MTALAIMMCYNAQEDVSGYAVNIRGRADSDNFIIICY